MTTESFDAVQVPEPGVTIALSPEARAYLEALSSSSDAPYKDMVDAFRFAVSLALAIRKDNPPPVPSQSGETAYNIGSFERDGVFKEAFQIVAPNAYKTVPLTRLIRCYGEWGVKQMHDLMLKDGGEFNIISAIEYVREQASQGEEAA